MKIQCEYKNNAMESSYQGASPITKGLHFGSRNFWSTLKVHPHHQKSSRHLKRRTFRLFLTFYTASLVSSSKVPISQSSQEILPAILSSIFLNINFWFCEVKNPWTKTQHLSLACFTLLWSNDQWSTIKSRLGQLDCGQVLISLFLDRAMACLLKTFAWWCWGWCWGWWRCWWEWWYGKILISAFLDGRIACLSNTAWWWR